MPRPKKASAAPQEQINSLLDQLKNISTASLNIDVPQAIRLLEEAGKLQDRALAVLRGDAVEASATPAKKGKKKADVTATLLSYDNSEGAGNEGADGAESGVPDGTVETTGGHEMGAEKVQRARVRDLRKRNE